MQIVPHLVVVLAALALPVNAIAALAAACGPPPATVQLSVDDTSGGHAGTHAGHGTVETDLAAHAGNAAGPCCDGCLTACSSACSGVILAGAGVPAIATVTALHGMQSVDALLPGPDLTVLKRPPKPRC